MSSGLETNVSEKSGAGFIKYVAAVGGFLLGWGIGAGIAGGMVAPVDSIRGRSATYGAPIVGVVLQFGLGITLAIIVFMLVKKVVDR